MSWDDRMDDAEHALDVSDVSLWLLALEVAEHSHLTADEAEKRLRSAVVRCMAAMMCDEGDL